MINNTKKVLSIAHELFCETSESVITKSSKMDDFAEWDSIGNFNLLLAIESEFNIRFTSEEIIEINSIEQILNYLDKQPPVT